MGEDRSRPLDVGGGVLIAVSVAIVIAFPVLLLVFLVAMQRLDTFVDPPAVGAPGGPARPARPAARAAPAVAPAAALRSEPAVSAVPPAAPVPAVASAVAGSRPVEETAQLSA